MNEQQAKQMESMWTRFFVGEIWVEPTLFDQVLVTEIRHAILLNWFGIFMDARRKEVLHSDHYSDAGYEYQIRTWVPDLYTEVFPIS